jgi:DNA-binding transcriptional regulator YiaG
MTLMTAGETWKVIPGYEGLYEVSDQGRVRGLDRHVKHSKGGLRLHRGKIISPDYALKYPQHHLHKDGKQRTHYTHQLVALTFIGPRPDRDYQVAHKDGNPRNNTPSNLYYATPSQNAEDKRSHRTMPLGSNHKNSKLKESDIPRIRQLSNEGMSRSKVAKLFGVCTMTIQNVISGKVWAHVQ